MHKKRWLISIPWSSSSEWSARRSLCVITTRYLFYLRSSAGSVDTTTCTFPKCIIMYFVPLELVREIIASVFDDATSCDTCEEPGRTCKPLWSSIEPLTVASKAYRALVLECWFRTFFTKSSEDLSSVQGLLSELTRNWTR
jgi:hypothetical protein